MPSGSYYDTYIDNPLVRENSFRWTQPDFSMPPTFQHARHLLPRPLWTGHASAIDCYWKVWQLAFSNLRRATLVNRFVAPYIDTAFNGHLFMWDSSFILLFARYGNAAFNFQRTLDNLYCKQHSDGFICREIHGYHGGDSFTRHEPSSTGPPIMAWCEWEYFLNFGDRDRLARVFPVLLAYHQWMQQWRTWPDGMYYSSGWGCGMDNQPRIPHGHHEWYSHAHQTWIDTCFQMVLSGRVLLKMADVLGRRGDVSGIEAELDRLLPQINDRCWCPRSSFYFDLRRDGVRSEVKTIGAYWGLLADAVPAERLAAFVGHLESHEQFHRHHRVPSLSADTPGYDPAGGYWKGGVWPPTNYMLLRGLSTAGQHDLARQIAANHHQRVVDLYEKTGTVYESYAPDMDAPNGKPDFVGWGGLGPVAVFFEYVLGLQPNVPAHTLTWRVNLLEAHGVEDYPFGPDGRLTLRCAPRGSATEAPKIEARSDVPVTVRVLWPGGERTIALQA